MCACVQFELAHARSGGDLHSISVTSSLGCIRFLRLTRHAAAQYRSVRFPRFQILSSIAYLDSVLVIFINSLPLTTAFFHRQAPANDIGGYAAFGEGAQDPSVPANRYY